MVSESIKQVLEHLQCKYQLLPVVDLDHWHDLEYEQAQEWLEAQCQHLYQTAYDDNQRLVFTLERGDFYVGDSAIGLIVRNLQVTLNEVDISNFFVIIVSTNPALEQELNIIKNISQDPVPITGIPAAGAFVKIHLDSHPVSQKEIYQYGSLNPVKIDLQQLSEREKFLLTDSKVFCIYPWTHMHAWPTGQAFPCCMSEPAGQIGDVKKQTLQEIWNGSEMRELRLNMLNERPSAACTRCYEQEESGFFSGRKSANKHHGHHIDRTLETWEDGTLDRFEMTYWDVRFSNLCNLRCRSCGHIFSSQWYQDQAKIAGSEWAKKNRVLNYAGRTETDMWEQLSQHLDYVEQIYFAGGEPLLMEEHYRILEELERRERFDVRLIYNTNFTQTKLKDRYVFDYWKKFDNVAVGASLDAMGMRAEYIRKGTDWAVVEENRRKMIEICPNVDFYISPTLSIMNAWHLPDFHRDWVEKGLIRPQDLNVNILQDPAYYRIDIAPMKYKQRLRIRFEEHLEWLRPQDTLQRASVGFESAIKFMMATDNTALLPRFWEKTQQLDRLRKESLLESIPELEVIK
jgi:sulfatase maturation enzyme AslB (radical SAM superfamily)